jgi:hypothetical protein
MHKFLMLVAVGALSIVAIATTTARSAADATTGDLANEVAVAQPLFAMVMPGVVISAEASGAESGLKMPPGTRLPEGDALLVTVPDNEIKASEQDGAAGRLATADAEWRLSIAASLAAARLPRITSFRLSGLEPSAPLQMDFGAGLLRPQPGIDPWAYLKRLGTVDAEGLRDQAESNVAVVAKAMGAKLRSSKVDLVPADTAGSAYGVRIAFQVSSLSDVADHLGDALVGAQTGLVGNQNAVAEGVAITLCDASQCAAGFSAARRQSGEMIMPRELDSGRLEITARFPNLTGGPEVSATAHGGPAELDRFARATLRSGPSLLPLRGIPCPNGDGTSAPSCAVGPPTSKEQKLRCPHGRKLVLRLHAAARKVSVTWGAIDGSGKGAIMASTNARSDRYRREWWFRVPRKASAATQLNLVAQFTDVSTTFRIATACS